MSERLTHYVNGTVVTVDDEFTIAGAFPVRGTGSRRPAPASCSARWMGSLQRPY